MSMIQESDKIEIAKLFEDLTDSVNIVNFTKDSDCQYCKETSQLVTELGDLSDKVESIVYNVSNDGDSMNTYNVEHIPATVIYGDDDRGIKFYGIPTGYEFATILETIKMVSSGDSGLSQETREYLKELKEPINLKVFVTPT